MTSGPTSARRVDQRLDVTMGIEILEASADRVVATMPVAGNTPPYGLLHGGATCVRVAYLHVAESARRRGAGSALVEAAATFAEEVGAPEIMVAVPPTLREANRFYARLALTPGIAHRTVPTGVLRRQLSGELVAPGGSRDRASEVVARRRRARAVLTGTRALRAVKTSGEH